MELINEYKKQLRIGICEVEFTKVNGETRHMVCTLDTSYIPEVSLPTGNSKNTKEKTVIEGEETIAVFDLKAEGWRSFRVANITSFGVLNNETNSH